MHGIKPNEYGPGLLADYLAELLRRFRHFSQAHDPDPLLASPLARIRISARLLGALGAEPDPGCEGFVRLGGVLAEWEAGFTSCPESFPASLFRPLERLADFLEEILARRDGGTGIAELAFDEAWARLLDAFRHAGTPLAVMDEVDDLFRRWGGRWTQENLTPVQDQQLRGHWRRLRDSGDQLFLAPAEEAPEALDGPEPRSERPRHLLLLVDSTFRRDQIRNKLAEWDFILEIPRDPQKALELFAAESAPQAVLCDQLEPTRHLSRLRQGLEALPGAPKVPLILVTSASGSPGREQAMASALGAEAAWSEPYHPGELHRILQRLSQP